jgi:hypothetical protein
LNAAMNCIILIVNSNIELLTKLNENVRINLDEMKMFLLGKPMNKIINVIINFKESDDKDPSLSREISKGFSKIDKKMKPVNLINYILNLIRTSKDNKNINLIRFLRAICNHNGIGITQN